jgi:hypothetical protein
MQFLVGLTLAMLFQDDGGSAAGAAGAAAFGIVFFLIMLVVCVGIYAYFGYCFMTIAKKTNTENAWLAWVPIANIYLMVMIARKPVWWVVLFFIPVVSIVAAIVVMMGIAEACGKPGWIGILMIVPGVNLAVPGYLAFSK